VVLLITNSVSFSRRTLLHGVIIIIITVTVVASRYRSQESDWLIARLSVFEYRQLENFLLLVDSSR
jgi:hypothetical protein